MTNRFISLWIVICTLFSLCNDPLALSGSADDVYTVSVMADGEAVEKIIISESEKKAIHAVCAPFNNCAEYLWQICADVQNALWVDICGANEECLNVSYAMLSSMLDDSGSAQIRAKLSVNEKLYYSTPICATVAYAAKLTAPQSQYTKASLPNRAPMKNMGVLGVDDSEYVTITINYLDWQSKDPVYSPYTATVVKGAAFYQEVTSPTFLGYAPYTWDGENFDKTLEYTLNYLEGELIADTSVNIYYKPVPVGYSVRYFFQNIANDLYTERADLFRSDTAETGTIVDNETLESFAGTTTGFTKLYHYPESVAADGSTVFECYYDRNYYFYKFNLNGGYGTDPIYARYGTPFTVPNPTRHGYVFMGWADVTEDSANTTVAPLPATIGTENRLFKAIWQTVDTTYSVVYWLENADDENGAEEGNGYSHWYSEKRPARSNDKVSGINNKDLPDAFTSDSNHQTEIYYSVYHHADEEKTVEGDGSTVLNVYYHRKEYNLKFYYAMESGEGDATHYYVVGGSTYLFGEENKNKPNWVDTSDEKSLLDQYNSNASGQRGDVNVLPTLNANGLSKGYVQGYDTSVVNSVTYQYYYIMFSAKYGSTIANKWPIDVFDPVTRISGGNNGSWSQKIAYPAGWNGEYRVKYNWDNSNETIKGKYSLLDDKLLWVTSFGEPDDNTVSYLCFWENGANVSWSVPRVFRYKIWLPQTENTYYSVALEGIWTPSEGNLNASGDKNTVSDANKSLIIGNPFYLSDAYITYDDSNPKQQTQPTLPGYTALGMQGWSNSNERNNMNNSVADYFDVNMFYSRNSYTLRFVNYGDVEICSSEIPYEQDISGTAFTPNYPETLEPNAYDFDGWYTTPEGFEGTQFDFTNATMPAKHLNLYAKWKPKSHTIRFFATYADMLEYTSTHNADLVLDEREIEHGGVVGYVDTPENPHLQSYTFGGWFHVGADNKTYMFAEYDTRINRDMNVYANWGSKLARPYRIHYALYSKETDAVWLAAISAAVGAAPKNQYSYTVTNGADTRGYVYQAADSSYHRLVADDTVGYAYEGSTRTFSAKAGDPYNQLYNYGESENYNEGYFPTLSSHSILVASEVTGVEQPENNVFTFYYVKPSSEIRYTVNYLDAQTNLPLAATKTDSSNKSVITERFQPIENYIPDAFYKRLILSVHEVNGNWVGNDANNVINFYYSYNENAAYYAVHHMLQKINTDGTHYDIATGDYEEDASIIEAIADTGSVVQIQPLLFAGFELAANAAQTAVGGTLSGTTPSYTDGHYDITVAYEGTDLYIYYTRNKYPLTVRYYRYNTGTPVNAASNPVETIQDNWYGDTVSYTAASEITDELGRPWVLVDTEKLTKSSVVRSVETQNEMIFYYIEREYLIEYDVVDGIGGALSQTQERSNTVINGSVATPWAGYVFEGWFLDEACTQPASERASLSNDGTGIVPQSTYLHPIPGRNVFYARFKKDICSLTIHRTNADDEGNGNQIFVYRITDMNNTDIVYDVTVKTEQGEGSVTIHNLPASMYEVQQLNDWSWRYADTAQTVDLHVDKTVTFQTVAAKDKWLNGNSEAVINVWNNH